MTCPAPCCANSCAGQLFPVVRRGEAPRLPLAFHLNYVSNYFPPTSPGVPRPGIARPNRETRQPATRHRRRSQSSSNAHQYTFHFHGSTWGRAPDAIRAAIICPFVLAPQVIESIPLASLPASSKWVKSPLMREIYAVAAESTCRNLDMGTPGAHPVHPRGRPAMVVI